MREQKRRILVVDDATDNQLLLATLFEASGYEVECTSNGQEALSLLRRSPCLPDLILLDAQMPVMDGFDFRAQQCAEPLLREIPVVVMTANHNLTVARKMLDPLMVLQKPLQIESLVARVANVLSNCNPPADQ